MELEKKQTQMRVRRNSRQRDAIWNSIKDRTDHPTADVVYTHVRETFPNISLGTVYRNLMLLKEMGMLTTVDVGDGLTHFDPNRAPHAHFVCAECGEIADLPLTNGNILRKLSAACPGKVEETAVLFTGKCDHCLSEEEKENQRAKTTIKKAK